MIRIIYSDANDFHICIIFSVFSLLREHQLTRNLENLSQMVTEVLEVTILYLIASIFFIQALKGLSHPTTSIRGNIFGMAGMIIAVLTTAALIVQLAGGSGMGLAWVLLGLLIGGTAGTLMAQKVEMTKMPELVAFMHSMIGLAAVFIAVAAVVEPWAFGHGVLPGAAQFVIPMKIGTQAFIRHTSGKSGSRRTSG